MFVNEVGYMVRGPNWRFRIGEIGGATGVDEGHDDRYPPGQASARIRPSDGGGFDELLRQC